MCMMYYIDTDICVYLTYLGLSPGGFVLCFRVKPDEFHKGEGQKGIRTR